MSIEKSLYEAPQGLEELAGQEPDIEIEIEDPEEVTIRAGNLEIEIDPDAEPEFSKNLVEDIDDDVLEGISASLLTDIENDLASRKDWEEMYKDGLTLLGLKFEERTEPWEGSCGVFHPMITEAVVRFQSETIMETFPAKGPVKTQIIGRDTPEKKDAAARIEEDMNYQLTEKMPEFRSEHERMLWNLPGAGSAFKKVYYDPNLERQSSVFIPAEDIILPYGVSDLNMCHRLTHRMRKTGNDIAKLMYAGFYQTMELGDPVKFVTDIQKKKDEETGFSASYDDRFELYEVHVDLDLPGFEDTDEDGEPTGIALPYVVTILRDTGDILAIRRNWKEDDSRKLKRQHFVHYQYIPGYGAYGFGLFHLIGGFAKSATSLMRQLVDAGTLSNLPGGLKARGLRIKGDDTPISPGEWRDVDLGSGAIKDNILPLPYKEPSSVLYQLLGSIVEEGRRFAATADLKVADMSNQAPVGSTLAILERTLKVMSAVQARVHYALKQELQLLAGIIRDYTPASYTYEPEDGHPAIKQSDYNMVEVVPVSDPNAATLSQRVVQYQAVMQMAQSAPQLYNMPKLHRQMLDVLGIKQADKLVPLEEDFKPTDPVSENMDAINGKPLKAFSYQDHEAHIAVHMAAAQDPLIQQMVGQNPMAQQIQAAMAAHISEHVAYAYRVKIEQAMGVSMPAEGDELPESLEKDLSKMMAQAAPQVLEQSKALVAQQQAQQNAKDPVLQIQMQELQLKAQEQMRKAKETEIKEKKLAVDSAAKADELRMKEAELRAENEIKGAKLIGELASERDQLAAKEKIEGLKVGADLAKTGLQRTQQQTRENQ